VKKFFIILLILGFIANWVYNHDWHISPEKIHYVVVKDQFTGEAYLLNTKTGREYKLPNEIYSVDDLIGNAITKFKMERTK
jgi:hypothetical protein